ncbi:MAG: UbiA family prenyltransferase [Planctomycetaceae bacterium]|nr:UbiA family prenyltransferase [Planctomycetaceae bacterium]
MTSPRPEFDEDDDSQPELPADKPATGLLAWLRLMRLPNVFTALADVTMGYLFVRHELTPVDAFACIAAASALLYTAGIVLNDVFDIDIDREERPERPLPSGAISLSVARAFGFVLLALGVLAAWLGGLGFSADAAAPWRSGLVATLLAALIVLYNTWLKRTPLGPLGMGGCRLLNVLLGMSLATEAAANWPLGYGPAELLAAGGIGVYIVGITWFARNEVEEENATLPLIGAIGVMVGGAVLLATSAWYMPLVFRVQKPEIFALLLALMMATVLRRAFVAAADPSPRHVQLAVKHGILSLIWLDAVVVAAVAPLEYSIGVALLLVPAYLLGRWVYST